jgi:hypothetical protein
MLGTNKVLETSDPKRDVFGEFNNLMSSAYFVVLNEVGQSDIESGKLKQLITDGQLVINNKGINSIKTNSYHHWMMTTNIDNPIKTKKDDRRNVITRSSDELCGNSEYFTKINELFKDINVIRTVYDYFKSIPNLDKFHEIPIPTSEYQQNLQELALTPTEQCIINLVQDNTIENINNIIQISCNDLFSYFNAFITSQKIEYKINYLQFNVKLKNLNINGIENKKGKTERYKFIDIVKVKEHFKINNNIDFIDEENEGDNEVIV